MGKSLVLAEKPSVGREIAKHLQCHEKGNGYFSGARYVVVWALGHLVTLADPEAYDRKYKTWKMEDLPMLPTKMELVVIRQTAKQFGVIKNLMRRKDIKEIIIATDAGREGELVARWIIDKVGWRKPIKRLWISSQTERAIKEGFSKLKPGQNYEALYRAAVCRAEADWLVGLNVTRALTCKFNAQLSAGRVQTPTLAMVVEREEEIKKFVPKPYWVLKAETEHFSLRWKDKKSGQTRIFARARAEELCAKLQGQAGKIMEIKKEAKSELPPLAYDLTELQREANRKYGFSAKKTASIMQQLYERHKLVTYPRTDSRYLTEDIVSTLPERLASVGIGPYVATARLILNRPLKLTKRLVDNRKVTDHHAIIPTEQPVNLSQLTTDELKVYDLIVKKFFAVLMAPFVYERTIVKVLIKEEVFVAQGKTVKDLGWRSIYTGGTEEEEEDTGDMGEEQTLPILQQDEALKIFSVEAMAGETKPPVRYTEATLLSAMEYPGKLLEDQRLRALIDSGSGLGTPATRADIIEKLFSSFYLERQGKELIPTSKGKQLVDLVPTALKSPELTAKWEQQLTAISKGQVEDTEFIRRIRSYAAELVTVVLESDQVYRHDNLTRIKCPTCEKFLLRVKGKRGEMLICSDRECGYRKGVSLQTKARCPECHKRMELRGEGENKIFACVCGYREKLARFEQRKEGEKGKSNKKEVERYLKQQDKRAEPKNTALAEALAKWKLR